MDNWHLVVNHMRHAVDALQNKQNKKLRDRWLLFWKRRALRNLEKMLAQLVEEGKR